MQPARIAYASCPLGGDAAIFDLREADCTCHPRRQAILLASVGRCRYRRCGIDVITRKR